MWEESFVLRATELAKKVMPLCTAEPATPTLSPTRTKPCLKHPGSTSPPAVPSTREPSTPIDEPTRPGFFRSLFTPSPTSEDTPHNPDSDSTSTQLALVPHKRVQFNRRKLIRAFSKTSPPLSPTLEQLDYYDSGQESDKESVDISMSGCVTPSRFTTNEMNDRRVMSCSTAVCATSVPTVSALMPTCAFQNSATANGIPTQPHQNYCPDLPHFVGESILAAKVSKVDRPNRSWWGRLLRGRIRNESKSKIPIVPSLQQPEVEASSVTPVDSPEMANLKAQSFPDSPSSITTLNEDNDFEIDDEALTIVDTAYVFPPPKTDPPVILRNFRGRSRSTSSQIYPLKITNCTEHEIRRSSPSPPRETTVESATTAAESCHEPTVPRVEPADATLDLALEVVPSKPVKVLPKRTAWEKFLYGDGSSSDDEEEQEVAVSTVTAADVFESSEPPATIETALESTEPPAATEDSQDSPSSSITLTEDVLEVDEEPIFKLAIPSTVPPVILPGLCPVRAQPPLKVANLDKEEIVLKPALPELPTGCPVLEAPPGSVAAIRRRQYQEALDFEPPSEPTLVEYVASKAASTVEGVVGGAVSWTAGTTLRCAQATVGAATTAVDAVSATTGYVSGNEKALVQARDGVFSTVKSFAGWMLGGKRVSNAVTTARRYTPRTLDHVVSKAIGVEELVGQEELFVRGFRPTQRGRVGKGFVGAKLVDLGEWIVIPKAARGEEVTGAEGSTASRGVYFRNPPSFSFSSVAGPRDALYLIGAAEELLQRFRDDCFADRDTGFKWMGSGYGAVVAAVMALNMGHQGLADARAIMFGNVGQMSNLLKCELEALIPQHAQVPAESLFVSVTVVTSARNEIVSAFPSRDDLIKTLLATCYVPVLHETPVTLTNIDGSHGKPILAMAGSFSNRVPLFDALTITVSPIPGEANVAPWCDVRSIWNSNSGAAVFKGVGEKVGGEGKKMGGGEGGKVGGVEFLKGRRDVGVWVDGVCQSGRMTVMGLRAMV
ncbi:hypothetical protein HDU98_010196 [Podochytrium sp. JEL0797]|nr:hypothetical protein HDU98_010196 [Podochytrium sp. JEL0797]